MAEAIRSTSTTSMPMPWIRIWLVRIPRHELFHFTDRSGQTDASGTGNDAVADVQFREMRHFEKPGDIMVVDPVTRVDLEAAGMTLLGRHRETLDLALDEIPHRVREATGVKLDHVRARLGRSLDLLEVRIDEKADFHPGALQPR